MKEIVKSIIILAVIYLLLFFLVNTNRKSQVIQEKPETIYLTDTLTQVMYDTVFVEHFETVKLPVVDTLILINDSIRIDSIFVEIPISKFQFDTTLSTDTTCLNIRIQNSGYAVKLDTLLYKFTYSPTPPKLPKKKHRIGFYIGSAVGLGYDWTTGKTLPSVGVGIGVGWSVGKY